MIKNEIYSNVKTFVKIIFKKREREKSVIFVEMTN